MNPRKFFGSETAPLRSARAALSLHFIPLRSDNTVYLASDSAHHLPKFRILQLQKVR